MENKESISHAEVISWGSNGQRRFTMEAGTDEATFVRRMEDVIVRLSGLGPGADAIELRAAFRAVPYGERSQWIDNMVQNGDKVPYKARTLAIALLQDAGDTIEIQYVSGLWAQRHDREVKSPDMDGNACLLVRHDDPSHRILIVPRMTKEEPCRYVYDDETCELALRIDDGNARTGQGYDETWVPYVTR